MAAKQPYKFRKTTLVGVIAGSALALGVASAKSLTHLVILALLAIAAYKMASKKANEEQLDEPTNKAEPPKADS